MRKRPTLSNPHPIPLPLTIGNKYYHPETNLYFVLEEIEEKEIILTSGNIKFKCVPEAFWSEFSEFAKKPQKSS